MSRLPTSLQVSALLRRINSVGGFGTVLHKGDPTGGIILVQCLEQGRFSGLFERVTDLKGKHTLVRCGPEKDKQDTEIQEYILKRRRADPDLWLIELDVAEAQRFAAELLCGD